MNLFEARVHSRLVAGSHVPAEADIVAIQTRSPGARRTLGSRRARGGAGLPAPPPPRHFGLALHGHRLFLVECDAWTNMTGAVRRLEGLKGVAREDLRVLGVVTIRRFRLMFADGSELTLDAEATRGVARFLDYLSALTLAGRSRPT